MSTKKKNNLTEVSSDLRYLDILDNERQAPPRPPFWAFAESQKFYRL